MANEDLVEFLCEDWLAFAPENQAGKPLVKMRGLLGCALLVMGCSNAGMDAPLTTAPQVDTEAAIRRLNEIKKAVPGNLSGLLGRQVWVGDRLRVLGLKDQLPVTESIGAWRIELVPSMDQHTIEIRGLLFAKRLDFDKVFVHGKRAHEYGILSGEGAKGGHGICESCMDLVCKQSAG